MEIKSYGVIEKRQTLNEGEVEVVVSTGALDSHGERINVEGISLKDYKKNGVILWGHDGFSLPIAKTVRIWKDQGKLMAKAMFDMADENARKIYNKIKGGYINAVSIGGMVDEWGEDGVTIEKLTMKEFSFVSIGANPQALVTAKALGVSEKDLIESDRELDQMIKNFAKKLLNQPDELEKKIEETKRIVATLEELAKAKPDEEQATNHLRVMLKTSQSVDQMNEQITKTIKVKLKESINE